MWPFRSTKTTKDRRLAFLETLAGADRTPMQTYRRLLGDEEITLDEVQDAGDLAEGWQIEDAILDHVMREYGLIDVIDWVEDISVLVAAIDARLQRAGKPPIEGDRESIVAWVLSKSPERGDAIGFAYGPLAEQVESRGLRILNIYAPSDCYRLAIVTPEIAEAWIGMDLSAAFSIDDPSWSFEDVLTGGPFQAYLRPRVVKS